MLRGSVYLGIYHSMFQGRHRDVYDTLWEDNIPRVRRRQRRQ